MVAQSIDSVRPMIMVTFNYRLNIFAFGDGLSEINLALQDQKLALEWVQKNNSSFGGDPVSVSDFLIENCHDLINTISASSDACGESAGAVCVHAHILSQPTLNHVQRAILASESLKLSTAT